VQVWGKLAVRQQQLRMPTENAKATLVAEARRLAADQIAKAAQLQVAGDEAGALAELAKIGDYGSFLGQMLMDAGLEAESATPSALAERYLGALTLPPESEAPQSALAALAAAAAKAQPESASLTSALLAMSDASLAPARAEYTNAIEASISAADFGEQAAASHAALADKLALPAAVVRRLSLDAYYGWLLDTSERNDREALEGAAAVRTCLCIDAAAVSELHANTAVDELVLSSCCEAMLAEETPLSDAAAMQLAYLEGQLAARPGIANAVVRAAAA